MKPRTPTLHLVAVAALLLTLLPAPARAGFLWLNSNSFGANSSIIATTGQVSYITNCPGGIADFIYPWANIYIVPVGVGDGAALNDVSGSPNVVQYILIDEVLGNTGPGGNIPSGRYAVIMDECQDGKYNAGIDYYEEITVTIPSNVDPLASAHFAASLAATKAAATQQEQHWADAAKHYAALFAYFDALTAFSIATDPADFLLFACTNINLDTGTLYCSLTDAWMGLITLQNNVLTYIINYSFHYKGIAADPPDPAFSELPVLDAPFSVAAVADDPIHQQALKSGELMAQGSALSQALLTAMERYQGAEQAGMGEQAYRQAQEAEAYARELAAAIPRIDAAFADLATAAEATGADYAAVLDDYRATQARVKASGLTAVERTKLLAAGWTETDISGGITDYLSRDFSGLATNHDLSDLATAMAADEASTIAALTAFADDMASEQTALAAQLRLPFPHADAGGPYTTNEGVAVTLDASASTHPDYANTDLTYAWDIDLDGVFDDATGMNPTVTIDHAMDGYVGVQATSPNGFKDVAYARITVNDVNRPPEITAVVPAGAATIAFDGSQPFSVTATDPDGDALTYAWDLDGTPVGTGGTSYTYTAAMADVGEHVVTVTVSDGQATSPDTRHFWRLTVTAPDADGDGFPSNVDCDDTNPNINPGQAEIALNGIDDDCDPATPDNPDVDGDGYDYTVDCDDNDPAVHPGALEVCNQKDDDCDGTVDEGYDNDGDGFSTCALPTPDCDDANAAIHPGATELCNLIDDNCDGAIDEGLDGDGDGVTLCAGDCDDTDAAIYPGNTEVCDGKDNDCNGTIDEGFDADGDGFTSCATPIADCDDSDPNTYPGAPEICDSADNNCNGLVDEGVNDDTDGDGVSICGGDCNDVNAAIYPGATELCNLIDDNCDGTIDEGFDADGDGVSSCAQPVADCDDTNPSVYPGRVEVFHNHVDDDCDPTTADDWADTFIIATDDVGGLYYAKSNGDGTWANYRKIAQLSGAIRGAAIADYDGDGDLDFIVGSPSGHTLTFYLYENDGTDHFTTGPSIGTGNNTNSYQMDMTAGDFDHDGDMDFISDSNWHYVHYGRNDGNGHFTITTVDLGVGNGRGMDAADFDHDGNLDYVRAVYSTGQITLYRGNGDFTFTDAGVIGDAGGDPYGVAAADFNEDGHVDVIAIEGGSGNSTLFAGNGDGTFQAGVAVPSVDFNNHGAYDAYDFNRDGHQDLVTSSYTSRKLYYYPGNGDGTFGAQVVINTSNTSSNTLGISAPPGPPPFGDPVAVILPPQVVDSTAATIALSGAGSTDDGTITDYAWDFDDTTTATGADVTHTFPGEEGDYHVTLTVTDNDGKVGVGSGLVRLLGTPPVADTGGPYTFGEAFANAGVYTVTLDGSGSTDDVGIASYEWNFGETWLDDFADGVADGWTPSAGTWFVNAGAYEQSNTGLDRGMSFTGDPAASDFTYEADITLLSGWGQEAMLLFRSPDDNNRYELILRGRGGTNDVLFARVLNGSWRQLVRVTLPFSPDYNTVYHLKVEAIGSTFRCYLDGDLLFSHVDSSLPHGRVGFATYRTHAAFDNVHFAAGARAAGATVTHTYGLGTYTVSLTVTDTVGQQDTATTSVAIVAGDPPVADPGGPYTPGEANANCDQWTVSFDGTGSTDDNAIYKYEWDFGDGSTGTGATPTHTYTAPGTYTVTLTVTDHALQTNSATTTVTTTPGAPPVADAGGPYTVDESAASNGMWSVTLDGTGSTDDNGICDYQWDFGDGSTGTGATPTHEYAAAGDYTVTLTVRDHAHQAHSATSTVHVTVNDPPVAAHGGPYAIDEHQASHGSYTATFDATSSTDDFGLWKYEWDFGDGTTGTGPTPTHVYTAPGTYTVTLTVTDNGRQSTTTSTLIAVTTNGAPIADAGPAQTTEAGLPITLDATGSTDDVGISTYLWDFDLPPFTEDFASGLIDTSIWAASTGTTVTGGEVVITGASSWGSRYLVSNLTFDRVAGDSYTGRIRVESGGNRYVMWGLKNTNGNYSYTQFLYAIYFNNNRIEIYESGNYRGNHGTFADNTDYDVRIDLKASGATYFVRESGTTAWTQIYDSTASSATPLRLGATVHSGVIHLDDFVAPSPDAMGRSHSVVEVTYSQAGTYHPSVTVTDNALQSDTDTTTITVVVGDPPVAKAGGPYTTQEDLPTRFNARGSSDDFGIQWYAWDFGDGTTLTTRNPFADHRYTAAGSYTATLTVTDFAGQSASDSVTVNVSADPVVACVPWQFTGGVEVPHDTWSGKQITLKGVVWSLQTPLTYTWDFGDGSAPVSGTVTDKRHIEAKHTYTGVEGAPFVATLTVTDANGVSASDRYLVRIRARSLEIETNVAIDEGLWYLQGVQSRSESDGILYGSWTANNYTAHATGSAVQAFEINGHLELGDVREDPYVETVSRGLHTLFSLLRPVTIGPQTYGDPDTNANGIGIEVASTRPIYEGGMVMDAIASSGAAATFADTGPSGVQHRNYKAIIHDMVDQYAWGQDDDSRTGGWRYGWNQWPDNSACQWAAIGLHAAKEIFGLDTPQWVKDRDDNWLSYSFDGAGFGYTGAGNGVAQTPSGLVQMSFAGNDTSDPRWVAAESTIANNWDPWYRGTNNYYALFAVTKSMRLALPSPVVNLSSSGANDGLDWFNDPVKGVARTLIDDAFASSNGSFSGRGSWLGQPTRTAWGIIMLTPTLFVQPPVADAGSDRVWGVDVPLTLDGSGSFHLDPFRSIVKYEWDLDGDGVYDTSSTEPTTTVTYSSADYPASTLPTNVTVRLRVTDNNDPPKTDTDTAVITIAVPPHPPIADAGGPYTCTAGLPCTLDGSASFDIDPTDFITTWEWDTNNDGTFGDATGKLPVVTFTTPGIQNVGLQVWDNAVLNDTNGNGVQDPEERLNDHDFTTVTVVANEPPVAEAGGPYAVDEGSSITLDGSGSSDPNGDALTYAWDLDNNGAYDNGTGATATFAAVDDTTATVGLWVSDGVLVNTTTTTVVVNNVAPAVTAGPGQAIDEGSSAAISATFTDPGVNDTHTATVDWGDGSSEAVAVTESGGNGSLAASHLYPQDGGYTVTITVTDDDGGVGTATLTVSVRNLPPVVDAGADQGVIVGEAVSLPPATFTDAGVDDTHTATVDWGDGTSEAAPVTEAGGNGTAAGTHAYAAPGLYTVTVTVTDDGGASGSDTFRVSVGSGNSPPSVDAGPDRLIDEGTYDLTADFTDVDLLDTHTATIDWGDGSPVEAGTVTETGGNGSVAGSHAYLTTGNYTVTITVTDNGGLSGSDSFLLEVGDGISPPTEDGAPNGGDGNGDGVPDRDQPLVTSLPSPGGTYVTLVTDNPACKANRFVTTGSEADQAKPDPIYDYPLGVLGFTLECTEATITIYYEGQATLDGFTYRKYGPTTPGDPSTTTWYTLPGVTTGQKIIGGQPTAFATFVLRDGALGDSTGVDGRIVDPGGPGLGPPTADAGGPYTVAEGSSVTLDGSGSFDPNHDPLTYAWDFNNDGAYDDATGVAPSFAGVDDGVTPIALEVSDGTFTATDSGQVTVTNVAPAVTVGSDRTIDEGGSVALSPATFTDPGVNDTHTATIDWGDGSPAEEGVVTEANGNGSVDGSHPYPTAGTYTVTVTVTDDDGGVGSASFTVTVQGKQKSPISDLTVRTKLIKAQLVWTCEPAATGYNVYRSSTPGGPYQVVALNHQTNYCLYLDQGLTMGQTYYYVITWIDGTGGESPLSNEVTAVMGTFQWPPTFPAP